MTQQELNSREQIQRPDLTMNALAKNLREQIQRRGPMPFAEFMACALYDPAHGYYARADRQIGEHGDFITSVSIGACFGELLAFQFARWKEARRETGVPWQIVECGAHDGQLACDILEALEVQEPALFSALECWIIEPSLARRAAQQATLERFSNVRWFDDISEIHHRVHGVIYSNELLDAMPVHPFAWHASSRRWEEMGVTVSGESFAWTRLAQPTIPPPELPDALLDVLPDGYIVELSPAATRWWSDAAVALTHGHLLAFDYGGALEELLSPGRTAGTLRTYSRHHVGSDVLAKPGEQDITAHVDFSAIQHAGEVAGLKTVAFTTQGQFLTGVAQELWARGVSWSPNRVRQFQTLTHPEHLGHPFRVLVQAR